MSQTTIQNDDKIILGFGPFNERTGCLNYASAYIEMEIMPDLATGGFLPKRLPMLVKFCRKNPRYHIMTWTDDAVHNCWQPDAEYFQLGTGDANPDLMMINEKVTLEEALKFMKTFMR